MEALAGEQHQSLKAPSSNKEVDYRWNTCWLRQNAWHFKDGRNTAQMWRNEKAISPFVSVRQALIVNMEKWLEEELNEMIEDNRQYRHWNFFRRMGKLTINGIFTTSMILDDNRPTLKNRELKLARWQRQFVQVLDV